MATSLKPPDPQIAVIFGASGDLTRRKLLPAFWHLFVEGLLPQGFAIVAALMGALGAGAALPGAVPAGVAALPPS